MATVAVILLFLCLRSVVVKGVTLILKGESIPTDGSGRILITDINTNGTSNHEALTCQSEPNEAIGHGNWSLDNVKIGSTSGVQGWETKENTHHGIMLVRLVRISYAAEEGVFACHLDESREPAAFVGIYYPINSTIATFVLVDRREKKLRVKCTSTGGKALNMTVTGPVGFNAHLNHIEAVGDAKRIGDDKFAASTGVISKGEDGDIYQCTASNGVSSNSNSSMELRVASAPDITSLEQISATAVRVEWSQPSEGATVTGYIVHYSDGDTDRTVAESVVVSSTSFNITHLTNGLTYTISVEATSQHLSGESDELTISLDPLPAPHELSVSDVKSTSVRVSWQAVENADRYTVTLSQTMGDNELGLCPEASHIVSINTSNLSAVVGRTDSDMLRAYTTYSITVVAESDVMGRSQHSDPVAIATEQTNASVSPHNVSATVVNSTVISVQWDGLRPCSPVNGLIVQYRVQYIAESSGVVRSIDVAGEWNVMRAQTSLTGLTPYTNYSIEVAAVNEQGDVGRYSDRMKEQTEEDVPGPVLIMPAPSFFTISIAWDEPAVTNGVIIAYEVCYRPRNSLQCWNTTNLATSFTVLKVGTKYNISVRAYTSVGPGATESTSITIFSRPPAVQGVKVASVNATAANISWNVLILDLPIDKYTVVYRSNDVEMSVVFPAPATSGVINNLNPADIYHIQVFATVTVNGTLIDGERSTPVNLTYNTISDDMNTSEQTIVWVLGGVVAAGVVALGCIMIIIIYILRKCCQCKRKSPQRPSLESTNFPLTSVSSEGNTSDPMNRHVNKADRVEKEVPLCANKQLNLGTTKGVLFPQIPVEEFGDYVSRCHANVNKDFSSQYTEIDRDGDHSIKIGFGRDLRKLHRFANITVYDDNRIILKPIAGYSTCQRDFINASYIDGYNFKRKFIATQGPMSETSVDFWRLVWQERPHSIVMVTNLEEENQKKCHQYWPDTGSQSFGPFNITITDQQILADYTTRWLSVKLMGSSKKVMNVTQFHFTAWPDHGVPDYATSLLAFHKRVKRHHKPSKGPMLVHCSAGVGRTGTLITIDCVLDQLQEERVVDIASIIIHLRTQRMKMVQTLEQYIFIHDAILEAIACGDTQINASNLRRRVHKMCYRDPTTNLTDMENQFKTLDKISPNPREILRKRALENPARNRSDDYLPGDRWRVILRDVQDYIHAVYVNGYKQQKAFIIAQSPMQSTIRDFWKMIHDRKCGVIIMLCDLVENGQEVCHQYWPTSGTIHVREYTVDLQEEKKKEGYIVRHFSIVHKKLGKDHQVVQLHITNWSPGGHCSNFSSVINVIAEMAVIQRRTGNKPVLVHCSDTVSRSGMFCAIATTIERCKTEGVVDVFQVVKALRVQKPGAVCNVAHFHMVFEAVLVYLDTFDTYSNFRDLRK